MIRKRMERSHTIMAKWMKKLLGLAAIGSAAAGLVYYFKKSKKMWMKISTMILK